MSQKKLLVPKYVTSKKKLEINAVKYKIKTSLGNKRIFFQNINLLLFLHECQN